MGKFSVAALLAGLVCSSALPDLGSSAPDLFHVKPQALPGSHVPFLDEPYPHLFEPAGPPGYWQTDPLYVPPAL